MEPSPQLTYKRERVKFVALALEMGEHRDEHDKGAIQQADRDLPGRTGRALGACEQSGRASKVPMAHQCSSPGKGERIVAKGLAWLSPRIRRGCVRHEARRASSLLACTP